MDCTGLYWAVLGCTGLYWVVLGYTQLYSIRLCWTTLDCNGLYWTVFGSTVLYLIARVIGFQKMYGLFSLNHNIIEKMCDVTPVTDKRREDGKWKIGQYFGIPDTAIIDLRHTVMKLLHIAID